MNVLIVGSGAREYAIARRLKQDSSAVKLYFSPGNGASTKLGQNLKIDSYEELANYAKQNNIELTIVGPEAPLEAGIVDIFKKHNLLIFGPTKKAAMLESSKAHMKDFLTKYGIKTSKYLNSTNLDEIDEFIDKFRDDEKIVVKADGLCAGKGVIIAQNKKEAKEAAKEMLEGSFGEAGKKVVVEEFLDGFELSFFAICDGKNFVSLPAAQDHKRLKDGDKGPNTGGMGAYAPAPLATKELIKTIEKEIVAKTLDGMQKEGEPFCGVLFVGVMVVDGAPYVLEFNVRFGDPECEVLMPLIKGNFTNILKDAAKGELEKIEISDEYAAGVVMASQNYPYKSSPKEPIFIEENDIKGHICFGGVSMEDGKLLASGGRVLVCVGIGKSIKEAVSNAYKLCNKVKFKGDIYRKDIAYQALKDE